MSVELTLKRHLRAVWIAPLVIAMLAACSSEQAGGAPQRGGGPDRGERAVNVIAQPLAYATSRNRVQSVGNARAKLSAEIFPETAGEVTTVNFTVGSRVNRGQVLVRLDGRQQRLAVQRAEVAVRDAEQLLDRYERIDVPGAISESQIDTARTALEAAKIDLDLAKAALEDRTVRAPFTGYAGLSNIDPGARVTSQTRITQLDDRSELFIDFDAPEQVFGGLLPGDTLELEPFSSPGTTVAAIVDAIDTSINATTRTFLIRTRAENQEDTLRPGMSFRVTFDLPGASFPTVPEASILWGGDGAYIWTVADSRVVRTPVDIVSRDEGRVLVRGDLSDDALVIIEGVQKVRPGSLVQVDQRPSASAAPGSDQAPGANVPSSVTVQ
jgi:membrane fusion protein (multidrug efflux system)